MADADALKDDHVKALTVAIATSPPEAAALTDALESAGIPTHVQDMVYAVMLLGLGILTLTRARFMKNPALETVFATRNRSQEEKPS